MFSIQCAARGGTYLLTTSGFAVLWNDAAIITESPAINKSVNTYTFKITATQISNKLTLMGLGTVDSYGTACDNVKINQITANYFKQ
jgi:hypothetical protein